MHINHGDVGKVIARANWVMAILGAFCLGMIIILITVSVVKRFTTGSDLFAVVNLGELLIAVTTYFGLGWTQLQSGHVSCSVIYDRLSGGPKRVAKLVIAVANLFFGVMLLWASTESAVEAFLSRETAFVSGSQLPIWIFRWTIPIGVIFYMSVLLIDLKDSLTAAFKKEA